MNKVLSFQRARARETGMTSTAHKAEVLTSSQRVCKKIDSLSRNCRDSICIWKHFLFPDANVMAHILQDSDHT